MNKKVHSFPLTPVNNFNDLIKSLKLSLLYPLTISIDLFSKSKIKLANLVKLYFPLQPTPINITLPLGYLNTLAILKICSIASSKNINLAELLYYKNSSC